MTLTPRANMAGWDRANGRRRDAAGGGDSGVHGRDLALGPVRLGRGFWLGSGRIFASEIETPSTCMLANLV
jgi:hypothetical protein